MIRHKQFRVNWRSHVPNEADRSFLGGVESVAEGGGPSGIGRISDDADERVLLIESYYLL